MKSFWTILVATLAVCAALPAVADEPIRVVVDAGHGGAQEGAVGPMGTFEKNISLQIATKLRDMLQKQLGAIVLLTRDRDNQLQLSERVSFANKKQPNLFISIHANSMPTRHQRLVTEGIETFFLSANASYEAARLTADRENAESVHSDVPNSGDTLAYILADLARSGAHQDSSRLAYSVHKKLIAATGAVDRGVQQAPFFVLMGVEAPAILVEVGFISHPDEEKKLVDPQYQLKLATAITLGVKSFLDMHSTAVARPSGP